MLYNDWVFFSFTLIWWKILPTEAWGINLNIVTDKGIQRTYLTAIKINHKMIRICKTDNYSLPQHLLFCVLGFVFNFVHSVISIVKSWPFADCINSCIHFERWNNITIGGLPLQTGRSFIHEKYLSKTTFNLYNFYKNNRRSIFNIINRDLSVFV